MKHKITELSDGVCQLNGIRDECCIYLFEGRHAALVIDTGLGAEDIRTEIEDLTELPYTVVNTHGHGDHSGGNLYFHEVFMSRAAEQDARAALEINKTVLSQHEVEKIRKRLETGTFKASYVSDGFVFDLGGKRIEVIEIPGHTPGCIALLDREDRLLFSGDCMVKSMDILLTVPQSLSMSTYLASMKKLRARRGEFDALCTGHDHEPMDAVFLDEVIVCCEKLLSGELEGEDIELPPVFGDTRARRIQYSDFSIVYRPNKL